MGSITSDSKPPEYGRRLIPQVIDEIAARDPQREAFQLPQSDTDPKKGWKVVTYGEYAAAINRSAHEVVKTCGAPPTDEFPTIAYIGPQDVRYLILLVAAVKAGYKVGSTCHQRRRYADRLTGRRCPQSDTQQCGGNPLS